MNLPKSILSTPTNPLLLEIKNNYSLVDPSTFSSEISRDLFYYDTNFMWLRLLRSFLNGSESTRLNSLTDSLGLNLPYDYLFLLASGTKLDGKIGQNHELFKNQFRPIRKGVNNMIRLHATGAIAMPIELRLHILASSKDVIHS